MEAIRVLIGTYLSAKSPRGGFHRLDTLIRKITGIAAFGVPTPEAE